LTAGNYVFISLRYQNINFC